MLQIVRPFLFISLVFLATPTVIGHQSGTQDILQLPSMGQLYDREFSAGQSHLYQITLVKSSYLKLVVEQRKVDVALILRESGTTPGSKPFREINTKRLCARRCE